MTMYKNWTAWGVICPTPPAGVLRTTSSTLTGRRSHVFSDPHINRAAGI